MYHRKPKVGDHTNFNDHKIETELKGLYGDFVIGSNDEVKKHFLSPDNVINVISKKRVTMQQNSLLEKYLCSPSQNLTLDCDKITFNANISENDMKRFRNNFGVVKTKERKNLLIVRQRPPQCDEERKGRFICSRVFTIYASTNLNSKVFIYLCVDKNNWVLHVAFTPRLFADIELAAIFHHILTTLGKTRYLQVISKARLSRIDIGFNLPNISKACLVAMPKHRRCTVSNHYPNSDEQAYLFTQEDNRVSESYYCGSQKGSHLLVYDRYLRVLNLTGDDLNLMARVEYRHKLHADKAFLTVEMLSMLKPKLHLYKFVSPWIFKAISAPVIELMVTNQGLAGITRAWFEAKKELSERSYSIDCRKRKRKGSLSLKEKWLMNEQKALLERYQHLILNPKVSSHQIKEFIMNNDEHLRAL